MRAADIPFEIETLGARKAQEHCLEFKPDMMDGYIRFGRWLFRTKDLH